MASSTPSLYQREANWQRFADEIGGVYHRGSLYDPDSIKVVIPPWTVLLTLDNDNPRVVYTRLSARFTAFTPFSFTIYREGVFTADDALRNRPDIEIGMLHFDRCFHVTGEPEPIVRELLANDALRHYLLAEPQIGLSLESVPGEDRLTELTCVVLGPVAETTRLLSLFELMGETLQHLCALGVTTEAP